MNGRWALVGDAAGFVDPLTREGIAHAMRSAVAMTAALAARGRLSTPPLPADLAWAHLHGRGFYRRAFLEAMTRLAMRSAAIRGVLADLLDGRQGYRGLKLRLLMKAIACGREAGVAELLAAARGALRS
jgi:flavin-dependent dehydrogenase